MINGVEIYPLGRFIVLLCFFLSSRGRMLGLSCQALLVPSGKSGHASWV